MSFQQILGEVDTSKPVKVYDGADGSKTLILTLIDGHELMIGSKVTKLNEPYHPTEIGWCLDGSAA